MNRVEAYVFACPFDFSEMAVRLNALGRYSWGIGDSAWYGDYLKVWPYPNQPGNRVRLRIYDEFPGAARPYVLEIIFESAAPDAEAAWQTLDRYLHQEALPALDAMDIIPTDTVD